MEINGHLFKQQMILLRTLWLLRPEPGALIIKIREQIKYNVTLSQPQGKTITRPSSNFLRASTHFVHLALDLQHQFRIFARVCQHYCVISQMDFRQMKNDHH